MIGALALAYLVGPLAKPDWRGNAVSLTGKFAVELRDAIQATATASNVSGFRLYKTPYPGRLVVPDGPELGFLAADRATGNAVASDVAIIDEAGLMDERDRPLWNSMLSSTGGRDGRLIAISVRGDSPMVEELLERREESGVVVHLYEAEPTADYRDPQTWAAGNPGLAGGIKSVSYMEHAARRAAKSPSDLAHFRTFELNMRGAPDRVLLVGMADWAACVEREAVYPSGPCFVGVDLGGSASMTAAAAWWPEPGLLRSWAALPGVPNLRERGEADGVADRYERMLERGELVIYPGVRTTPVAEFLGHVTDQLRGEQVVSVVADRYRQSEAQDAYQQAGIRWPQIYRGTGWRDASHDVRAFQRAVVGRRLWHCESLLMESALLESALATDPAGNAKLDKARSRGRIDAASASVLALGEAERWATANRNRGPARYFGVV